MRDPQEGLGSDGLIRTGARRDRVPAQFEPVLSRVVRDVTAAAPDAAVYVYGSVATGQAVPGRSDVDLLTIGLPADTATIASSASERFDDVCRSVEIGAADSTNFEGDSDEAYGNQVFLHHYCVHLSGPDRHRPDRDFPGDRRAARGFNGDIARHLDQWRREFGSSDPAMLGRRVARKTLLAVAGLVSVHDTIWTTDRQLAAERWGEVHPHLRGALAVLLSWSDSDHEPTSSDLSAMLDGVVPIVVDRFADAAGLWPER